MEQQSAGPSSAAEEPDNTEQQRPEKRRRIEASGAPAAAEAAGADAAGDAPPPPPPADQIGAALAKIANHIGSASKFNKASQLLRQLMDAVDRQHRAAYFRALSAAFANPEHAVEPQLRVDYIRLTKAATIREELLSKQQRAQVEVYAIWGQLRNELFTDDSFVLNKVVARVKAAIAALPESDQAQEAAWARLHPGDGDGQPPPPPQQQQQQQQQQGEQREPQQQQADESDPFGLGEMIARQEAQEAEAAGASAGGGQAAPAAGPPPGAGERGADGGAAAAAAPAPPHHEPGDLWDPATLEVMRKQALLDCLVASKTHLHKLAWARTSVELLIEEAAKPALQGGHAERFVGGQRRQLQALLQFVNAERAARKSGVNRRPGGKGTGEYQTSFERARAEWGSAGWVSARGKVGSQGDAKANNWLG